MDGRVNNNGPNTGSYHSDSVGKIGVGLLLMEVINSLGLTDYWDSAWLAVHVMETYQNEKPIYPKSYYMHKHRKWVRDQKRHGYKYAYK